MRLGLVTDVHNPSAELARALALFRGRHVDRVLTILDTESRCLEPLWCGQTDDVGE